MLIGRLDQGVKRGVTGTDLGDDGDAGGVHDGGDDRSGLHRRRGERVGRASEGEDLLLLLGGATGDGNEAQEGESLEFHGECPIDQGSGC